MAIAISNVTQTIGQVASGAEEVTGAVNTAANELQQVNQTMTQLTDQANKLSEAVAKFTV